MSFATELKALFEKYDVKFDVTNSYTVEFMADDEDPANVVYMAADPESEVWDRAADRLVAYTKSGAWKV